MNRIAIIGSGISGLTVAWLAKQAGWSVTVFESQPTLGMDAHSIDLPLRCDSSQSQAARVDVPPRMFNCDEWPMLSRLYQLLGVECQPVDASKSFAIDEQPSWLQLGERYQGGFSAKALLKSKTRAVATETARLQTAVNEHALDLMPAELTLGDYLANEAYRDDFVFDFLYPGLSSTVLTCSYAALANYPARIALQSLLNQVDRSPLQRTTNGTRDVVNRLTSSIDHLRLSTTAESIQIGLDVIDVACADGTTIQFDQLVVATQANSASRLLGSDRAFDQERKILNSFEYENVPVVVHRDDSFVPAKTSHQKCFNFISKSDHSDAMCTIWLNRFYPEWPSAAPIFQTIRPTRKPSAEKTIAAVEMQRPVVNQKTLRAVKELKELPTDGRRVWFCGSYAMASVPLLESGVASALEVAKKMGIETRNAFVLNRATAADKFQTCSWD